MTSIHKILSFILLLLTSALTSAAQELPEDSTLYAKTQDSVIARYKNEMKGDLRLYNGTEYFYSGHNTIGFPYFKSPDILQGSVYYDGNLYSRVPMYYDLVNDELIILNYTKNFPIKLVTDKVTYFVIDGCKFLNAGKTNLPLPASAGFYEELYRNKTSVFAKKEKKLKQSAKAEDNTASYVQYNTYYIYSNNKMYQVTNERSVLKVFQKRKSELKKYIYANNIDFKKDFEEAIIKTAEQFDQIGN
jgi:hypothetical protein